MATKNDENWLVLKIYGLRLMDNESRWNQNYEVLKAHVLETGHFPNKHEKRLNWYKYNAKLIKQGKLSPEREQMIHELEEMRSGEHTGGRRRRRTILRRAQDRLDTTSPTMRWRYDDMSSTPATLAHGLTE